MTQKCRGHLSTVISFLTLLIHMLFGAVTSLHDLLRRGLSAWETSSCKSVKSFRPPRFRLKTSMKVTWTGWKRLWESCNIMMRLQEQKNNTSLMIITENCTELLSVANKTRDHHWISLCQRRNLWQQIFSSTHAWTSTSVLVHLLKILGNSWWRLTMLRAIRRINMFDSLLVEVITRFETHIMFLFHSKLLTFQQPSLSYKHIIKRTRLRSIQCASCWLQVISRIKDWFKGCQIR